MRSRRWGAALASVAVAAAVMSAPSPASAYDSSSGGASKTSGGCVAYATGTSMGSYCLSGGGTAQTLRQRFGGQSFDRCRFSPVPKSMTQPYNPAEKEGRWLVRSCIDYIDYDTVTGGPQRQLNIHLAWVDYDVNVEPPQPETGLSQFLWNQIERSTQFPVPFLEAKPTSVPRVGVPAYVTFRWLDPANNNTVVRDGPWADDAGGGPFIQIQNPNGMLMRARAIRLILDPLQVDMPRTDCGDDVNPSYDAEVGPDPEKQASDCYVYFVRSSAGARERARKTSRTPPKWIGDVYVLRVQVYWEVEYSNDGGETWDSVRSGNAANRDLVQVTDQPLPVREAQAAAIPPRISLR